MGREVTMRREVTMGREQCQSIALLAFQLHRHRSILLCLSVYRWQRQSRQTAANSLRGKIEECLEWHYQATTWSLIAWTLPAYADVALLVVHGIPCVY